MSNIEVGDYIRTRGGTLSVEGLIRTVNHLCEVVKGE